MATEKIDIKPFEDQKPGTSGLRKKTKIFMQPHYLAAFVQSTFDALTKRGTPVKVLLVGGDGRYFSKEAAQIITKIAAANGVTKVVLGRDALVSTPAASAIIRSRGLGGGFLLTASHNPGGEDEDFGIKYNGENGGPAVEALTAEIFECTKTISSYQIASDVFDIDLSTVGLYSFRSNSFQVEVIDPVDDWMEVMRKVFDFKMIQKKLMDRPTFSMLYDGMSGVAGPYAKRLILEELKGKPEYLTRCDPLPDFGGGHPDPNLVYAKELVEKMGVTNPASEKNAEFGAADLGAAGDGDCDRNMILGRAFFVTPSDSVALIAHYAPHCIPFFQASKLTGLSRSMPTSSALDGVAKKMGLPLFEVPTGWKFFGNLMDANMISICGEESFGTGSTHVREKDGLWAVLCWLSILAYRNQDVTKPFVSVKEIVEEFWGEYGRNYYLRYDYENVSSESGAAVLDSIRELIDPARAKTRHEELSEELKCIGQIERVDEFTYSDPVDKSVSRNQGLRVFLSDKSRIIYRLSGTGTQGATVRVYLDKPEKKDLGQDNQTMLKALGILAVTLGKIEEKTGRAQPSVIT